MPDGRSRSIPRGPPWIGKESVKRNRLVNLAARSMVLLSHER